MNPTMKKMAPVWGFSAALFLLRLSENMIGFDSETGLAVPIMLRYVLIGVLLLAVLTTVIRCRKVPADCPTFAERFASPDKSTPALILGCFLFIGGGIWLGFNGVKEQSGIATLVTAAMAFATGGGLLILVKQMRDGETDSVTPLLPAMFFGAFWVLTLYLPAGRDPVLARYWLPILAAAAASYAFAQLSGFFRRETKARTFSVMARLAVMLCAAAAAELQFTYTALYAACVVVLSGFLALEKE